MEEKDYLNFKILLEYYVSHLEWVTNNDTKHIGYLKYIEALLKSKNFKITGQGYNGGNIQKQISSWDNFEGNQVCINISFNQRTRYQSKICYLNWIWTGINIIAKWSNNQIVGLYQELFIEKAKPTPSIWQSLNMSKSLSELGLFDNSNIANPTLKGFYNNFKAALIEDELKQKASKQMIKINAQINLLKYKKQIILQGPPGTGKTREAELIAKEMLGLSDIEELENNEKYKLVQFHPSYTYEDFVRGISAKPSEDGKGVLYKAENKILSLFAEEAYKNYEQSTKTVSQISYKDWIDEQFDYFLDTVQASLDNDGEYRLSDKVKLFDLDDSSFYYTGDSWFGEPKHRMKFSDIKEGFFNNVVDAKSFKALPNTSGSAKQHYGYYYKVLSDFQNSIKTEFKNESKSLSEPKNYVLVIDEINRANLSSVLGELIYVLEYREKAVDSIYAVDESILNKKNQIILPPNLFIIGTMNTADRSVGHIDYAIRRRFAFVEVLPNIRPVHPLLKEKFIKISGLFVKNFTGDIESKEIENAETLASDFRAQDVWLGHSYFICKNEDGTDKEDSIAQPILDMKMQYEIIPILEEYVKDGILLGSVKTEKLKMTVADYIKSLKTQ